MFGSTALEIVIGLAFVYFLLSLVCSGIRESVASLLMLRAKTLEQALVNMLDDGFVKMIYQHPLVKGLIAPGKGTGSQRKPSYLSARIFTTVALDLATQVGTVSGSQPVSDIRALIGKAQLDNGTRAVFLSLLNDTAEDLKAARQGVEQWFDESMQRVSEWYRIRTQIWLVVIAAIVVCVTNCDTITIARSFAQSPELRMAVVDAAKLELASGEPNTAASPADLIGRVTSLELPVGWRQWRKGFEATFSFEVVIVKLFGLLLTTIAVSLGAPFWFDMLRKLVRVKSSQEKQ